MIMEVLREYAKSESDIPLCPDEAILIIGLLKRGKKFEEMWEGISNGDYMIVKFNKKGEHIDSYFPYYFKDKYFPKEK